MQRSHHEPPEAHPSQLLLPRFTASASLHFAGLNPVQMQPDPSRQSTWCPLQHRARAQHHTVDIVQWSMDSSEKRMASLMNTAAPRRMKEVKKWMWMEFLVQCSFL